MNNELYWVWLAHGLGAGIKCLDLISEYEWNPSLIYAASFKELYSLNILTRKQTERLKSYSLEEAKKHIETAKSNGWSIVTVADDCYPQGLLSLPDLPLVLYVNGNKEVLKNDLTISIVGARKASDYGKAVARALASALSSIGFTVVSGGALGVDGSAHLGTLDEDKPTVCVLGCGLGTRYLMENVNLRERITEKGAVISEYPPFSPATRSTFPLRNRIISGMSLGTIVVEAGERSGSLITARLAAEQGRDVFAVPGDLVSSSYLGTNNLIRNGAKAVFSPNDILEEYCSRFFDRINPDTRFPDNEIIRRTQNYLLEMQKSAEPVKSNEKPKKPKQDAQKEKATPPDYLTDNAKKIYCCIGFDPVHVDDIKNNSGLTTRETLSALTELEINGLIRQISGRRYKR